MFAVMVFTGVLGALMCGHSASARVLHVPADYSTLGFAMTNLLDGDTILASPGVYTESITAPALEFTLMSTLRIDSLSTEFVIIDPTAIAGSDSLQIMTLTGGSAVFHDIVFRNRSDMTEGRLASDPAGVVGDTAVHRVSFKRCVFDSVHVGITGMPSIQLDSCRFIGSRGIAARSSGLGKVNAKNTWFDGATGVLVNTRRGGFLEDCLFTHRGSLYMLLGLGDSLIIENCRFVGLDTLSGRAVWLRPRCGSIMRNCIFENIVVGFNSVLQIEDSCFQQLKGWECAFQLTNNHFINCGSSDTTLQQGGEMISLRCNHSERGYLAILDSNKIDSTRRIQGLASGMFLDASCTIKNTIFNDFLAVEKPQVYIYGRGQQDTFYFRHNSYSQDFDAMEFWTDNSLIDARWNWWGHESGPYHPVNNPQGQGASVDDDIRFNPWLLSDPDTTSGGDTTEYVDPNENGFLPAKFSLSSYPNPFNATTTLVIEVNHPGEYEVLVYDLMGREVRQLFSGRIDGRREIQFDGGELASGIYFARLSGTSEAMVTAKVLLLK